MVSTAAVVGSMAAGSCIVISTPSHNIKPGRRRGAGFRTALTTTPAILLFLCFLTFLGRVQALALGEAAGLERFHAALAPRQDPISSDKPTQTSAKPTKTSASSKSTSTSKSSAAASSSASSTSDSPAQLTDLPKVFDSNIGANFTNKACPEFLDGLSNSDEFNSCLPLSVLLVLDDACNAPLDTCENLMQSLALKLRSDDYCADDFTRGNPVVLQAWFSFLSYKPMYQVGCLKSSDKAAASSSSAKPTQGLSSNSGSGGDQYCFVQTVENASKSTSNIPVNANLYSLPQGTPLSAGDVDCNDCLRQTMDFFASAAVNASSPLSTLYPAAAKQINSHCGKDWVKATIDIDKSTQNSAGVQVHPFFGFTIATVALIIFGL